MTLRNDLLAEKAEIDRKLAILNRSPSDIFPIGTIAVFTSNSGHRWHYRKTAEETWVEMQGNFSENDLASWILISEESNVGYFEVYIMTAAATPVYTTS